MEAKPSFSGSNTWADDVDAEEAAIGQVSAAPVPPDTYIGGDAAKSRGISRSSAVPRSEERGGERAQVVGERIETFEFLHPPFKAYLSNIPYDLDEESVARFFSGLQIDDIIITRHRDSGRAKGCFVEFHSKEDLRKAISYDGSELLRRRVTIQIAEPKKESRMKSNSTRFGGFQEVSRSRGGPNRSMVKRYHEKEPALDFVEPDPESLKERPKLVLQPRSQAAGPTNAPAQAPASRGNPFGDARPADTAAKLKEIEERELQEKLQRSVSLAEQGQEKGEGEPQTSNASQTQPVPPNSEPQHQNQQPPPQFVRWGSGRGGGGGRSEYGTRGRGRTGSASSYSAARTDRRGDRREIGRHKAMQPPTRRQQSSAQIAVVDDTAPPTTISNPFDVLGDE